MRIVCCSYFRSASAVDQQAMRRAALLDNNDGPESKIDRDLPYTAMEAALNKAGHGDTEGDSMWKVLGSTLGLPVTESQGVQPAHTAEETIDAAASDLPSPLTSDAPSPSPTTALTPPRKGRAEGSQRKTDGLDVRWQNLVGAGTADGEAPPPQRRRRSLFPATDLRPADTEPENAQALLLWAAKAGAGTRAAQAAAGKIQAAFRRHVERRRAAGLVTAVELELCDEVQRQFGSQNVRKLRYIHRSFHLPDTANVVEGVRRGGRADGEARTLAGRSIRACMLMHTRPRALAIDCTGCSWIEPVPQSSCHSCSIVMTSNSLAMLHTSR